jgi:hypothetical protein
MNSSLLLRTVMTANPARITAVTGFTIRKAIPADPNSKLLVEDRAGRGRVRQ